MLDDDVSICRALKRQLEIVTFNVLFFTARKSCSRARSRHAMPAFV